MTDMLKELAEVADALDKMGKGGEWWLNNADQTWTIVPLKAWATVIRTHHAEIAQNAEEVAESRVTIQQLCEAQTALHRQIAQNAEAAKRLRALEMAMEEYDDIDLPASMFYLRRRAAEIMRGES